VGVLTGAVSGVVVIDLDYRPPVDGFVSWTTLMSKLGVAHHKTLTTNTPSDGLHLWYAHPGIEVRSSTSRLGPGIDVRGDRACIMAPPSVTDVGCYVREDPGIPIAPLPEAVVELVKPPPEPAAIERALAAPEPDRDLSNYVRAAVDGEVANVAASTPGNRNVATYTAALKLGRYVPHLLSEGDVVEALMPVADAVGLHPDEARRAIRSGLTNGMAQPRGLE
jgi:hypothetical protein